MRLPDRVELVLHRLLALRRESAAWPPPSAAAAEARLQDALREVRRAHADVLAMRAAAPRWASDAVDDPAAALERAIAEQETDLERRLDELRARLAELARAADHAKAHAAVAELAREADRTATDAHDALRTLHERTATVEAEAELTALDHSSPST